MLLDSIRGIVARRGFVAFLLILWTTLLASSPWWMAPSGDDGFYLYQIASFLRDGTFAVQFLDDWHRVYSNLPGYPAAQGLFFLIWSGLALPINVYTHGAFQVVCAIAVVLLGSFLAHRAATETAGVDNGRVAIALFATVLGVTPFPLDALYMRPEGLGLLLTLAGLASFVRAWRARDTRFAALAGLSLGAATTTHPTFIVTTAVVCFLLAIALVRQRFYALLLVGLAAAMLPLGLMAAYFALGGSEALSELVTHVMMRGPSPGSGLIYGLGDVLRQAIVRPTASNMFFAIPFAVIAIATPITAFVLVAGAVRAAFDRRWAFGPASGVVHAFFAANVVNLLLDSSGKVQIFVPMGVATALSAATLLATTSARKPHAALPDAKAVTMGRAI